MRLFIFGAGYSARVFARGMAGKAEWVAGTTRSPEKLEALGADGIEPLVFDGQSLTDECLARLRHATHLVLSAAPAAGVDPVLAAAGETIRASMPALRWIGYLSTVGVYGNHDGGWVTETSECRPGSRRSAARVVAEKKWLDLGEELSVPVAVLRLSGIYGPGRNALVNLANGTARRVIREGQVFNRIHVADIAGALEHLAACELGGVYNVSDDEPGPPQDVVTYAASLMDVPPPEEVSFEQAEMTPMARSFWGDNKRVSNEKLKQSGFEFAFPDYRTALSHMWEKDGWRSQD